jgi:hypothetical protein
VAMNCDHCPPGKCRAALSQRLGQALGLISGRGKSGPYMALARIFRDRETNPLLEQSYPTLNSAALSGLDALAQQRRDLMAFRITWLQQGDL